MHMRRATSSCHIPRKRGYGRSSVARTSRSFCQTAKRYAPVIGVVVPPYTDSGDRRIRFLSVSSMPQVGGGTLGLTPRCDTEKIINDDPYVKNSVMFGRGKFQNGVLIEPKEDYAFDPSDIKKLETFRNKFW